MNAKAKRILDAIAATRGAQPVAIVADVDARCVKKDRVTKVPHSFGDISKRIFARGMTGADYQAAVEREAGRQGADASEFEAGALPKGRNWVPGFVGRVLVSDDGSKFYLRTQTTPGQRDAQAARVLFYRSEAGKFLRHAEVKPYLPPERESNKQAEDAGLDRTVHVRDYGFEGIRSLRIGGRTLSF